MSELLMFSFSLSKKSNLPALTQTNSMNTKHIRAQFFYNYAFHTFHLASSFIFVVLACGNYKDHILGTMKNAEEFYSDTQESARNLCVEIRSSVCHLGHVCP